MKSTRRKFIKVTLISALSSVIISAPKLSLSSSSAINSDEHNNDDIFFLRPPGAIAEDEFLARCNRCQRCVQVCPTRVVLPASFKFGFVKANTPIVIYKRSYCNLCLKCSEVCPTGALKPVSENTLDIGIGVIIKKNCVAWDWEGCRICIDKCPLKAIYLDDYKRPIVIAELCNGCGICELECPSTSLRTSIDGKGIVVKPRPHTTPRRDAEYKVDISVYPHYKEVADEEL